MSYNDLSMFRNRGALLRNGLFPDRPDTFRVGWIANQQRWWIGAERIGQGLEDDLSVTDLTVFESADAGMSVALFDPPGAEKLAHEFCKLILG